MAGCSHSMQHFPNGLDKGHFLKTQFILRPQSTVWGELVITQLLVTSNYPPEPKHSGLSLGTRRWQASSWRVSLQLSALVAWPRAFVSLAAPLLLIAGNFKVIRRFSIFAITVALSPAPGGRLSVRHQAEEGLGALRS